jgi:hypothetical protein
VINAALLASPDARNSRQLIFEFSGSLQWTLDAVVAEYCGGKDTVIKVHGSYFLFGETPLRA